MCSWGNTYVLSTYMWGSEVNLRCYSSGVVHLFFVSHGPGMSPNRLGQLASELQKSACLYLYQLSNLPKLKKKIKKEVSNFNLYHTPIICLYPLYIIYLSSVEVCLSACWGFVVLDEILLGSPGWPQTCSSLLLPTPSQPKRFYSLAL